ncbi:MAG: cyclic nucleotide-binding domain-containing protein [Bacteroidetes bacterium]|nr:cyclic nucleotide-binding domain-containing protein [Bacteroidota bacterium]
MSSKNPPFESRLILIEKVLLLKSLSLFEETPETVLAEVAEILEEVEYEEGQNIFHEGDLANSMYIIFKGAVNIHKGSHSLAILKENDFFGELALLDTETRSASATAQSETFLLKIDQEPFYELMESRIEVAKGIIKTLCRRLRALNEKSAKQNNAQS